jgi:hypothetical protein
MDQLIQIPGSRILILATVRVSELCNFKSKSVCGLGFGLPCAAIWTTSGVLDDVFGSGGVFWPAN